MIRGIKGKLVEKGLSHLVIETGGISYFIRVMPETAGKAKKEGEEMNLWTHLSVKEDALDLYGFSQKNELEFFKELLTVSGIGPKTAMNILSRGSTEKLRGAISSADKDYLIKIAGLGRKNTEKIILELQNKIQSSGEKIGGGSDGDILEALRSLGYKESDVLSALKNLPADIADEKERLKIALRVLTKK